MNKDSYYSSVDARGAKHPKFPRWNHTSWCVVNMKHCTFPAVKGITICSNNYVKVGTIGYWDGSKKLIL